MGALVAALGCSVMMVLALGALAWYASRASSSRGGSTSEAAALQAELAALRRGRRDGSGDESSGRT